MTIYCIEFNNYCADTFNEYYRTKEEAMKWFNKLIEDNKDMDEFRIDHNQISFFDPNYNEYSTYITYREIPFDELFSD